MIHAPQVLRLTHLRKPQFAIFPGPAIICDVAVRMGSTFVMPP